MRLETDLRTFLLEAPDVVALVAGRIFGLIREPAAALPSVNLQRIHTQRQELFCGVSNLAMAGFQIDAYAIDGDGAWSLARALRLALKDFSGNMGATFVDKVFLLNEFPMVDSDPGVIRVVQTYNFWYVED